MADQRPTVELPEAFTPATAPSTVYSVNKKSRADSEGLTPHHTGRLPRAGSQADRTHEGGSASLPVVRTATEGGPPQETKAGWRVEIDRERLWLRCEGQQIELTLDDARDVALLILRVTTR